MRLRWLRAAQALLILPPPSQAAFGCPGTTKTRPQHSLAPPANWLPDATAHESTLPAGNAITFFTEDDSSQLRGIAHVIKAAGGDVPEWMLQLKKERRHRKAKVPAAGGISTEPVAEGDKKKKAQWRQKGKGRGGPPREQQQGGGKGGGKGGKEGQRQQRKEGGGGGGSGKGQKRPAQQQQQQRRLGKQQQQQGSRPPKRQQG